MALEIDRLTARQRAFVTAMVAGRVPVDAGVAAGISERTVRRYMALPKVRVAIRQAQDDALGDVVRSLNAGARPILAVLLSLARDADTPAGVRVSACRAWLDVAFKARELLDLTERVNELEIRLKEGGNGELEK
jgi:hypothetical protein